MSSPKLLREDIQEPTELLNVIGVFSPSQGPGEPAMDPLWPPCCGERGGGGQPLSQSSLRVLISLPWDLGLLRDGN